MSCRICRRTPVERAHLVPRWLGGTTEPNNLALLCPNHHRKLDRGELPAEELVVLEPRLLLLVEQYRDNLPVLEYLYWLLKLRATPPRWVPGRRLTPTPATPALTPTEAMRQARASLAEWQATQRPRRA